jgi:hypothetical protein
VSTGGATGQLTLHVNATTSIGASGSFPGYTPNATPYGFFQSVNDGQTWTQIGAWQSSTSKAVTGLALDTPLVFSARYRDNSSTPIVGDFATPVEAIISSGTSGAPLDGINAGSSTRTTGQIIWTWDYEPVKASTITRCGWRRCRRRSIRTPASPIGRALAACLVAGSVPRRSRALSIRSTITPSSVRAGRDRHGRRRTAGPATPSGGWSVAFADGFGTTLADRSNSTRRGGSQRRRMAVNGTHSGDRIGFNSNEIQNFNPSQVSLQSDGLHLICAYTPNRALPGNGGNTANYLSGFVQQLAVRHSSDGFKWTPGGGITLGVRDPDEVRAGFDGGTDNGGNDEGWWSSGGPGSATSSTSSSIGGGAARRP